MAYIDDVNNILQIQPNGMPAVVRLSQNENGRNLYFTLSGNESAIPSTVTVTISGTKPDGNVYSGTGSITNNVILIEETIQMTAVAGTWDAKIQIISGGNTIATGRIRFVIDADTVEPGSVPSESELNGLVAQAQQYAEDARSAAYGSPLTASTASAMIDKTRVYVYTGSESGYTNGHWYYWNGSAWTDGGAYNSTGVQTDTTLSVSGVPADAKATGDAITAEATARAAADTEINTQVTQLKEDLTFVSNGQMPINFALINDYYVTRTGEFVSYAGWSMSDYIPVKYNEPVYINVPVVSVYNCFYDSNHDFISPLRLEIGDNTVIPPEGAAFLVLSQTTAIMENDITVWRTSPSDIGFMLFDDYGCINFDIANRTVTIPATNVYFDQKTKIYVADERTLDIPTTTGVWVCCWSKTTNDYELVPVNSYIDMTHNRVFLFAFRFIGTSWNLTPVVFCGSYEYTYDNLTPYYQSGYFARRVDFIPPNGEYINFDTVNRKIIIPSQLSVRIYDEVYATEQVIEVPMASTTAQWLLYNASTNQFSCKNWNGMENQLIRNIYVVCGFRITNNTVNADLSQDYTVDGVMKNKMWSADYTNKNVDYIIHRGGSGAPENTMPAFINAFKHGAKIIETDVAFTSDNVAVLLHDDTINRTARNQDGTEISGTINISDITYAQALTYDFGIYYGSGFAGTKIPTLEEFLIFCKKTGITPDIELKTASNPAIVANLIQSYGLTDKVMLNSFLPEALSAVADLLNNKDVPLVVNGDMNALTLQRIRSIASKTNHPWMSVYNLGTFDSEVKQEAMNAGIKVAYWTINSISQVEALDSYYQAIVTDYLTLECDVMKSALY